jgi:hypothetical protein
MWGAVELGRRLKEAPLASGLRSWTVASRSFALEERAPGRERWAWFTLAALFVAGGILGPDTLGPDHGAYLTQRVVLCGLIALIPVVNIDARLWSGRIAISALAAAVALQTAIIWDYALYSDRTAGQIIRARDAVGSNRRLVTLPVTIGSRFRANPLLHVENWLGVDSGNVVWNNYETRHYYFPVQFRPEIDRPHPNVLERVALRDDPRVADDRSRDWERILARHADSIDVVVVYKSERRLDAVTERWFHLVKSRGDVRIFQRDPGRAPPSVAASRERPNGSS